MVVNTNFVYQVIAEENNHGRQAILTTSNQFQALKLASEINRGDYAGSLMLAEIITTIF